MSAIKIQSIETVEVSVPLIKSFKTSLRTVTTAYSIYVVITDEAGRKTRYDFDAPLMLAKEMIDGGIEYQGRVITFPKDAGLG